MAFIKRANSNNITIEALNKPNWTEYNLSKLKLASLNKDKNDFGGFNIKQAISENPDHLFVKVLAIVEDEKNDNGDLFPKEELIKSAHTFIGVPVFCNHQNDDIEKARGKVVHAWYDEKAKGIYIISAVDRVAYPRLARGIETGTINGTSMGVSCESSCCSICHNASSTATTYCDHIKNRKNRKFSGDCGCKYHDGEDKVSGSEDKCPICGCKKGETKENNYKEATVFEYNYGLKFIEDSFVVNPACHTCLVNEILNSEGLENKVAEIKSKVIKLANVFDNPCKTGNCSLTKTAGKKEIDFLTEAMDRIEKVSKSMMAQKQHISMEYVSELVDVMASVQDTIDELVEMGYGQLPSPALEAMDEKNISSALPQTTKNVTPVVTPVTPKQNMPTTTSPSISTGDLGTLGTFTKPKTSSTENSEEKKKDFIQVFSKFKNNIEVLSSKLKVLQENNLIKESKIMEKTTQENAVTKTAANDNSVITEKQLDNAKFTGERTEDSPEVITEKQLEKPKDVNVTTSKSGQNRAESPDVITEKQFDTIKSGYVVRWNEAPEVITEKQFTEALRAASPEVITEKQLMDGYRNKSIPEVITEKQLDAAKSVTTKRWADTKEIVKTAMNILADTVAYFGKTPSEIKNAVAFVNQNSKNMEKAAYMTIVNSLPNKSEARKAEKERYTYLSKIASTGVDTPQTLDTLMVCAGDNIEHFATEDIFSAMKAITASEKGLNKVNELAKEKMANTQKTEEVVDKYAQFQNAIEELDKPEDGLYQVLAPLSDVNAKPENKKAFVENVIKLANKEINDPSIKVALMNIDIDDENGIVAATMKDEKFMTNDEKVLVAQSMRDLDNPIASEGDKTLDDFEFREPTDTELDITETVGVPDQSDPLVSSYDPADELDFTGEPDEFSFENDKQPSEDVVGKYDFGTDNAAPKQKYFDSTKPIKTAQMFGGEMGGAAGAATGPGAGATLPTPPGAGAGQPGTPPPLESFEKTDMGAGLEAEDTGDKQIVPPGTKCVMCGSDDVDNIKGSWKCNNCGSSGTVEINFKVTNAPGILGGEKEGKEEGKEGEGFTMPETGATPAAPPTTAKTEEIIKVASYGLTTLVKPEVIKKLAENKIMIGTISPITGNNNTVNLGNNKHLCLDTGISYDVKFAFSKDDLKKVYAQWTWNNPHTEIPCDDCSRSKQNFINALTSHGVTEAQFDAYDVKEKGKTILAMKAKGLLNTIKTAGTKTSTVKNYKTVMASVGGDTFPMETCRQKIANRFGLNAVALSGPCEGKPLHDCVCKALKKAEVYSNGLAIKVAGIWGEKEASTECTEDCVRLGFSLKEASIVCQYMKAKYAQMDDVVAEEVADNVEPVDPNEPKGPDGPGGLPMDENLTEVDPFSEESGNTVSIELPLDLIEKLDKAIDVARGENPADEAHHNVEMPATEVTVEIPESAAEAVDQAADKVLNKETENVEKTETLPEEKPVENTENKPVEEVSATIVSGPVEEVKPVTDSQKSTLPPALLKAIENKEKEEGKSEDTEEKTETEEKSENKKEESETDDGKVEDKDEDKEEKNENPGVLNPETTKEKVEKEGEETEMEKEANSMKTGYISKSGKIQMDLSNVIKTLKTAKALQQENAQDVKAIGKIQDGKTLGHETKFDAKNPDVPTKGDASKLGKETPVKSDKVDVPSGEGLMGGEKDNAALKGTQTTFTGGEEGAGTSQKSASTKSKLNDLADRILAAKATKTAAEKKVAPKAPVSEDKDIQPIQNKKTLGDEDKFDAKEVKDTEVKSEGTFLGKEKETFKSKPDSPKDHPSIPAGEGKFKTEDNTPEKQEKVKGTVTAESNQSEGEAIRIAGRMLEAGLIKVNNLATKIAELKGYKLNQLTDIENSMFIAPKGLNTVAGGLSTPVVIGEESNVHNAKSELATKLSSMFSLQKQNELAKTTDSDYKKAFGK